MTPGRTTATWLAIASLTLSLGTSARAQEGGIGAPTQEGGPGAPAQGGRVRPRHSVRPQERAQDLSRQESQIRRTRSVTKRILRDRRASDAAKQQATELDGLLDKRQQLIDRLQERQKTFTNQHQSEIDELQDIRRRAREIDDRLGSARKDVLDASKDDIATLKDLSTRAADLADALRTQYVQERRGHRGQPPAGGADAK